MHSMENNLEKWKVGLSKTRKSTFGKIATFFGGSEITPDTWDDLEELFIQSDLGAQTSLEIIDQLKSRSENDGVINSEELSRLIKDELTSRLITPPENLIKEKPQVILIAGVNGSGKTTTIAKLGKYYQDQGFNIQFVAADTYRAAAVEQLQIWGERLNIPVTAGQQNGDPGAVVYDGIQSALAKNKDLVLIDTAGRLHTSYNLMEELKKVHRVAGKALPSAPHHSWLVMDATTGQNALHQAESFHEAIPLDGIILVKLDSSAKGGMAFAIQDKLGLPILFAGLGESPEDLVPFDPKSFVASIVNQG
jgi:fused signal recognition particle receptor